MLLHLSEVSLRGKNSFVFFSHLTFGLFLGLNFLFLRFLLYHNLLWRLCDLVGISQNWNSSVCRNLLSAARNYLEATFALFNLNWCFNDRRFYGVLRNEKVAGFRLFEFILHNRWNRLQFLWLLVADPVRNKFVMFADQIVFFYLRNPSWHLTSRNRWTEFLTHAEAIVLLEFFFVPEKIITVSHKFWIRNKDIFVKIASLHAVNAKCIAFKSKYFVFVKLFKWL